MKRFLLLALLLLSLPVTARASAIHSQHVVPAASEISLAETLKGITGGRVIAYHTTKQYLGVEVGRALVWHVGLPGAATKLSVPGPTGLFGAWVPTGTGARFYAYVLKGSHVVSGIENVPGGVVEAGEGGTFGPATVTVKNHDAQHAGSVSYRLLDRYGICGGLYCKIDELLRPDYPRSQFPTPNGLMKNSHGDELLLKLEVANTEAEREQGLMFRPSLDPDSGMVFVWPYTVQESFWMENTLIPLTVAFLAPDGTILDMEDMQAQTTDLHTPPVPYQYAIEANVGYFKTYGIKVGDKVALTLPSS